MGGSPTSPDSPTRSRCCIEPICTTMHPSMSLSIGLSECKYLDACASMWTFTSAAARTRSRISRQMSTSSLLCLCLWARITAKCKGDCCCASLTLMMCVCMWICHANRGTQRCGRSDTETRRHTEKNTGTTQTDTQAKILHVRTRGGGC